MKAFAEVLSMASNLMHLDLAWNEISDEGIKAFAHILSQGACKNLIDLDISMNFIAEEGVDTVSDAMPKLATWCKLLPQR